MRIVVQLYYLDKVLYFVQVFLSNKILYPNFEISFEISGIDISDLTGILSDFPTDDVARRAKVWHKLIVRLQESISSLEACRKPVLAAVHSACVGAGVDLISAADMRYCTKDAWFQVKEVRIKKIMRYYFPFSKSTPCKCYFVLYIFTL